MKAITAIFLFLVSLANAGQLKISIQINTDEKIIIHGRIQSDPSIKVDSSLKFFKKEGQVNHYDCVISFSRTLNDAELEQMDLVLMPDSEFSDPLGFGEVFSKIQWRNLKNATWKISLYSGTVELSFNANKDERVYCEITSGNGYSYRPVPTVMREDNKCFVRWRSSGGESTIRIIKEENFMNPNEQKIPANWSSWRFDPSDPKGAEFIIVKD